MNCPGALQRIRIVLAQAQHPGNIGAAARAMKTMGLSRLYLVNPREFPHPQATAMASGADDVLAAARLCASLPEALSDTVLAAALTARPRELAVPMRWAREAAAELVAAAGSGEVALVFGNETSGLSNDELALCHLPVSIPANPAYSSLNLAAAVQVLCYELQLAAQAPGAAPAIEFEAAHHEDVERLLAHFESAMVGSGFLDPARPRRLMPRLRRLFARARLEREEVNILRGMLAAFESARQDNLE
ncbi:MAG: RNA methyltransferase [Rhodocyclaceae bacterium]|nr:RNA methyltransferase [Rhodocyclaceae bacterium]MBX3668176.1 RNA methyltransferase [Rhodocyclaceae bacterium]